MPRQRELLLAFADWPQHHRHVAAVLLRPGFNDAVLGDIIGQAFQKAESEFGARLLTSTEHDRNLHLGALFQETNDVALLGLVVMVVNLGTELLLFNHGLLLVLTSLAGLLGLLVLELAVVHDFRHGGLGIWSDFNEIEIRVVGQLSRIIRLDDADLFAAGTDESDLRDSNAVVYASFSANVNSSVAVIFGFTVELTNWLLPPPLRKLATAVTCLLRSHEPG